MTLIVFYSNMFVQLLLRKTSTLCSNKRQACDCKRRGLDYYLGWPRIHHGGGENCNNGGVWIQHAFVHHCSVLLHPPRQRHVVVLGPAAQRVQQQDGPAVAALDQTLLSVLHQKGVAVVDWVTELEGKDGVYKRENEKRLLKLKSQLPL